MMGWLGTIALAANQIVMSMISLTFMISSGIAGASTILVSRMNSGGEISGKCVVTPMLLSALPLFSWPEQP
ncbi:MAG: MATE family efflux transporter [Butyricimonas faecihominis]